MDFSVSKYLRCLEHLCKFSTKSIKDNHWALLGENFGLKIRLILQCKNTPLAQLVDVDSVGFSPLCTYMTGRGKGANNRQF